MSRFRIAPYRDNLWVVERKVLWCWWRESQEIGYGYTALLTFPTGREAENYILRQLAVEHEYAARKREARHRRGYVLPREFP